MSKLGPKCQYFVWPPLFSSTAFTLLGMEFTRASQVATGAATGASRSWWMLETLRSSTFHLRMPHRLPLPSASLARQWLSWRCVWHRYHVVILPCGPVSEGTGSISASVCHSTCWHSWFPQWNLAPHAGSTYAALDHETPITMLDCVQDTLVFLLHTWLPPHILDTFWTKYVYLGLTRPQYMVPVIHFLSLLVFSKLFAGFLVHHL